jgi:hypothetical protein
MYVGLKWACAAGALVVTVWSAEHGLMRQQFAGAQHERR